MGNQAIYREIQRVLDREAWVMKRHTRDMAKTGAKWVIKRYIVPSGEFSRRG